MAMPANQTPSKHQPDQSHPATQEEAPDASNTYERAHPDRESPSGSLDRKPPQPHNHPDMAGPEGTSRHTNRPNSDSSESSTNKEPGTPPGEVNHSMREEEPAGWDQAPQDIKNPEHKRHSRTEGKGGLA